MSDEQRKQKAPPRGLKAIPWRLPIYIYRLGLGFLFGARFLLLTHIGRKSGLPRQAVIEVIHHDAEANIYYAASGFGEESHWFRNIIKTPQVTIQVGRRKMRALAKRLSVDEGEAILQQYAQKHPVALRVLSRYMGVSYDDASEGVRRIAEQIPVVAFAVQEKHA